MSRMTMKIGALAVILLAHISCQNAARPSKQLSSAGPVHHVIVCWLKKPGNAEARERIIRASKELGQVPGVVSVRAGSVLPDARPNVDSSFDVAVVMTFESEAALREYPSHPLHQKALAETIKPLVARYVAYDFIDGR